MKKRLFTLIAPVLFTLVSTGAVAQQGPGNMGSGGGMMGGMMDYMGGGMGVMMLLPMLIMVLVIVLLVMGIIALAKYIRQG